MRLPLGGPGGGRAAAPEVVIVDAVDGADPLAGRHELGVPVRKHEVRTALVARRDAAGLAVGPPPALRVDIRIGIAAADGARAPPGLRAAAAVTPAAGAHAALIAQSG